MGQHFLKKRKMIYENLERVNLIASEIRKIDLKLRELAAVDVNKHRSGVVISNVMKDIDLKIDPEHFPLEELVVIVTHRLKAKKQSLIKDLAIL